MVLVDHGTFQEGRSDPGRAPRRGGGITVPSTWCSSGRSAGGTCRWSWAAGGRGEG